MTAAAVKSATVSAAAPFTSSIEALIKSSGADFAVVTTGSEAGVWAARDVTLAKNTGWDFTGFCPTDR